MNSEARRGSEGHEAAAGTGRDSLRLEVVDHPLAQHKLTCLRDRDTSVAQFRSTVRELGRLMAFAATADLPRITRAIDTPMASMDAPAIDEARLMIVPVLRAGLPLAEAFSEMMPSASIGHVGVYRDAQARPVEYLVKLPTARTDAPTRCFVVDPMLATGRSAAHVLDVLIARGYALEEIRMVSLLAAPEGLDLLGRRFPGLSVHVTAIDSRLDENAYIVPGLGDAGDRMFGTEH
ncbi:MAG: uracil phosphoribosyltransferase [Proteobacteria bacterium]|nr:uracil phosphoribosyltransferase [Burkholderiales bacterium]